VTLPELLAALASTLDRIGVPYMVVGSLASAYHGEPRATQDVDVVIDPSADQMAELLNAFDPSLFYVGDGRAALADRTMFNVIELSSGWKIDFIVRRPRAFSVEELERRLEAEIVGIRVFLASAEDTVLSKLEWSAASGSERQLSDAASVVMVQGDTLDWDHLERWARVLGVEDDLDQLR
jgi:hypothetical protein